MAEVEKVLGLRGAMVDPTEENYYLVALPARTSADLRLKYPRMFKQCMFELSDDHGWFRILDKLCYMLQRHYDLNLHMGYTQVEVKQVKEKFGGLRFYYHMDPQTKSSWSDWSSWVRGVVDTAEFFAASTCEECGEPGSLREQCGYYYTSCSQHVRT